MRTSRAHLRSSGGLLSEICNMTQVLQAFLRGHIEAMLVLRSDDCELAVFSNIDMFEIDNEEHVKSWNAHCAKYIIQIHFFALFFQGTTDPVDSPERLGTAARGGVGGGWRPSPFCTIALGHMDYMDYMTIGLWTMEHGLRTIWALAMGYGGPSTRLDPGPLGRRIWFHKSTSTPATYACLRRNVACWLAFSRPLWFKLAKSRHGFHAQPQSFVISIGSH